MRPVDKQHFDAHPGGAYTVRMRPGLRFLLLLAVVGIGLTAVRTATAQRLCGALDGFSTCVPADTMWPHAGGDRWLGFGP